MLEVMIAITILSGVIVFIYSVRVDSVSLNGYVYGYEQEIMLNISVNKDLRVLVLDDNVSGLMDSFVLPSNLNFSIKICNLTTTPTACNMDGDLFLSLLDKEIFVSEIIVAGDYSTYDPKKVKLFIWEN